MILYSFHRSSASMRVRIALNLKNLEYQYRAVNLLSEGGGEQFAPDFRQLNPSCEVPTLVHDGLAIGQSTAIIDYLDQIQPRPRLFPEDPRSRAQVWQACEIVNSGSQAIHNHRVDHRLESMFGARPDQIREWMKYWVAYGLRTLEEFLVNKAGEFSVGDQPSAADCFLVPHMVNARRIELDLKMYPTLVRVDATCRELDAFRRAAMDRQPDAAIG